MLWLYKIVILTCGLYNVIMGILYLNNKCQKKIIPYYKIEDISEDLKNDLMKKFGKLCLFSGIILFAVPLLLNTVGKIIIFCIIAVTVLTILKIKLLEYRKYVLGE
ncbi:MAG: hypothetical protein SOR31_03615 [Parvimonas sp.]|uniref:hypothetical protein n=1 Tax=Parvimonas sp. TaxID=1944660 RepID=UPI0025E42424|nr:hypothetical protein [Parvimonas sp.]MCI5997011.1 hypothetical protein [Parvimonas sp.]MDY3050704.1 hypothetical protein [Parvimonas sp.]